MTLAAGTKLGPYEVISQLGAGGMGEVYKARDPRLGREVAIKVLPASFSQDADRLKRFEQEARAAGVLNHPGITAVYDIGSADGSPYIVTELLEGETLRGRLGAGAVPVRKAIDYAVQIAKGLAAAHEKGIVHRDLKPENLFLTKDGRVKILDFGLAKLKPEGAESGQTDVGTVSGGTQPGVVLGTMGYMAPEQVRGRPADRRSDLFAFGTILYEMLSGQRAFRGDTAADTITAILTKEPPDLSQTNKDVHPGLDRIVRHCLEKNPEERFESARDVAFDLEALSSVSAPAHTGVHAPLAAPNRPWALLALAALIGAALASPFVFSAGKKAGFVQPPTFHQITFSRGEVGSSLFAPDGQTIVYSAGWEGKPFEIFINRPESPESRPFGLASAEVLSISRAGEMAVSLNRRAYRPFVRIGRLARISIAGGAPRDILDDVQFADWSPDGQSLAIVRDVGVKNRLEYPIGKVLFETTGWVGQIRVSPKGDMVAFVDHPFQNDDGGRASVVDLAGKKTELTPLYATVQGLAWTPDGREIWYTAAENGFNRAVHAVTPSGKVRLVGRVPGISTIRDISKDGRVLMTNESARLGILARVPGDEKEHELSWLDYSLVTDITPDGQKILLTESGEGGGPGYSAYLRKTDGSPAVRIGAGYTEALSPDGAWAISITAAEKPQLLLLPTSVGEARALSYEGVDPLNADFLPDGKQIVFSASQAGRGTRLYLRGIDGSKSRAITPEGYSLYRGTITPDGKSIVVRGPDRRIYLYPLAGGEPRALEGLNDNMRPARFSPDGKYLYLQEEQSIPMRLHRYDMASGKLELWKELMVADAAGLNMISRVVLPPDGRTYAYSYLRVLSYLQLVEGMK
ncbi:MAG TPA: protein kinase [Thermoanaerobaculia bacterium]|nr:protein kinase [Thermoanaerobaculia bacterium]